MTGIFHLAFATRDLERAKSFYGDLLKCEQGRSGTTWVDYDFFGHQLTIQFVSSKRQIQSNYFHPKTMFPANHFGIVLNWSDWQTLKDKLVAEKVDFVVEPQLVFKDEVGEQTTMMIKDDDGNILEFKSFQDLNSVFKK